MDGTNMMSPADIAALTGNNGMNGAESISMKLMMVCKEICQWLTF